MGDDRQMEMRKASVLRGWETLVSKCISATLTAHLNIATME